MADRGPRCARRNPQIRRPSAVTRRAQPRRALHAGRGVTDRGPPKYRSILRLVCRSCAPSWASAGRRAFTIKTAMASRTKSTNARSSPKTKTASKTAMGCPDFDNDDDGVPDDSDRCPPRKKTATSSKTTTAASIPTTTTTASWTPKTPARRRPAPPPAIPSSMVVPRARSRRRRHPRLQGQVPDPRRRSRRVPRRRRLSGSRQRRRQGAGCRRCVPARARPCALSDPTLNGCPSPDQDGDTFDDQDENAPISPRISRDSRTKTAAPIRLRPSPSKSPKPGAGHAGHDR